MATSIQIDDDCRQVTYLDAIRAALEDEMAADPRVLLLGEDIGVMGGAFRVTRGLWERYGDSRVIDTPIAEAAIVGCAIGLALEGLRPIVELQFADFISCAYDQLVSEAAKLHYRWGMAVPIVVRGPAGAGIGAGPFHSQSPEGVFRARSRPEGRMPGHGPGRVRPPPGGGSRPQPGAVLRAQGPVPQAASGPRPV